MNLKNLDESLKIITIKTVQGLEIFYGFIKNLPHILIK